MNRFESEKVIGTEEIIDYQSWKLKPRINRLGLPLRTHSNNDFYDKCEKVPPDKRCKSMDKTDLPQDSMTYENYVSPYWDDPRLLEKHNDLIKPIRIRSQQSNSTVKLPAFKNLTASSRDILWKKYDIDQEEAAVYRLDSNITRTCSDYSDYTNAFNVNYNKVKRTTVGLYMIMGCICGIFYLWWFVWLLNHTIFLTRETSPDVLNKNNIFYYIQLFSASILNGLDVMCSKLYALLMTPVSEVLSSISDSTVPTTG